MRLLSLIVLLFVSNLVQAACYSDLLGVITDNANIGYETIVFQCYFPNGDKPYTRLYYMALTPNTQQSINDNGPNIYCPSHGRDLSYAEICTGSGSTPPLLKQLSPNKTKNSCASIVRTDTQVLNEYVELTGIEFPLVYSSEKVKGRKAWNTLDIPTSFSETNTHVVSDEIKISVNGETTTINKPLSTSGSQEFIWSGAVTQGTTLADVAVYNEYDFPTCKLPILKKGEYLKVTQSTCAGKYVQPIIAAAPIGNVFTLAEENSFSNGNGWDFSIHHKYDEIRKTLFLGDGSSLNTSFVAKSDGTRWISSRDRSEVYVFSSNNIHLSTLDIKTGIAKYIFNYDQAGLLSSIADKYGNLTTLQYNGSHLSSITSPYGIVTSIELDSNGYISKITNPNNESHLMTYSSDGLMLTFAKPNSVSNTFVYNARGELLSDVSSAGNSITLNKVSATNAKSIYETSSLNRSSRHNVYFDNYSYRREDFEPNGFRETTTFDSSNITMVARSDGSYRNVYTQPDTRLNSGDMISGITEGHGVGTYRYNYEEVGNLSNPGNPFSFTTLTSNHYVNFNLHKVVYTPANNGVVYTSPQGRKISSVLNSVGDTTSIQQGNFSPVSISYDSHGRLASTSQGDRTTTFTYNISGLLDTVTNALNEVVRFTYDAAGRMTGQRLGDNRLIKYSYDSNGNVTTVTPPFSSTHEMTYNGFDLLSSYIPPTIGLPSESTNYVYSNDKELLEIHRPDGATVLFNYDQNKANLNSINLPNGNRTYTYSENQLIQSISEDFVNQEYTYSSGTLRTESLNILSQSFGLQYGYNDDINIASESISSNSGSSMIYFGYDADTLLTSAGQQNLNYDTNGSLYRMTLENIVQDFTYSVFGELASHSASYIGSNIYSQNFTRDALGRIKTNTEKYGSQPENVYEYTYDKAGRLTTVLKNGNPWSSYTYDYNSNRIGQTVNGVTLTTAYSPSKITLGDQHSCALTNSGVKCWGEASYGALGYRNTRDIGDNENLTNVNFVRLGNVGVADLTSGSRHNCVKYLNKEVRCWGENTYGQLGLGNTLTIGDDEHPAVEPYVNTVAKVLVLGSGAYHNCVVQSENKVSCWGLGSSGQLGYANTNNIGDDELPDSAGSVDTGVTNKIIQLALGDSHSCLLTTNGKVKCWGSNSNNQLGTRTIGVNVGDDEAPSAFGFLNIGETVKQISAAGDHTCALMETGKLKCWGRNDFGQLGLGNTTTLINAVKLQPYVDVGEDVTSVSTGRNSTCVVTVSGKVKCWGLNDSGQLGQGNTTTIGDNESPSVIQGIDLGTLFVTSVSVGEKHSCAQLEDKTVTCWGNGVSGRLGYGNQNTIGDNEVPSLSGAIQGLNQAGIKYDEQDRLLSFGTKSFAYNANGDLISEFDSSGPSTKSFEYDVFGNLKQVVLPNKTIKYKLDALNRRIAKLEGTTVIEYYIWNSRNQLVGLVDSSGSLISRFVYGSKENIPEYVIKNGVNYQILSNHLGSPSVVVKSSDGTIVQQIEYDEFGNVISDSQPGFTPFGFAGCLFDVHTKLCRFGARDYDSFSGRWLSKDPIILKGGDTNLYNYVLQDPINDVDLNGLSGERRIADPYTNHSIKTGSLNGIGGARVDFIVTPNGTVYPTYGGRGPTPVTNQSGRVTGTAFTGGRGGANGQVSTLRIMDPVAPRGGNPGYPNGYIRYDNPSRQAVDPNTGKTIPDTCGHYPIE